MGNSGSMMDKSRENIPEQCRIGDTCFMSLATIGGNLFTRHLKNHNNAHKYSKYLLSVIIISVTDIHGGKNLFITKREWMTLEKEHMFWSIHMEGEWLVPLIKF